MIMMSSSGHSGEREYSAFFLSGWLLVLFYLLVLGALFFWNLGEVRPLRVAVSTGIALFLLFATRGFIILEPNIAAVLTFFGRYAGSLHDAGFSWCNPFCLRQKISLRVYNQTTSTLKVNDKSGNPVEVAAVVAWRIQDTARAVFDVENYADFVTIQSESALRQVVSSRHYDGDTDDKNSLRGDLEAVAQLLTDTIQTHVDRAGIEVIEAKIAHLAYAPEIANAMLRRQQAAAVVAARTLIVKGAVSMTQLALERLEAENIVRLSEADKTHLVTNLLTVLVSENDTQPVLSMTRPELPTPK
jgi:regulator of protease activity HflC (stomatin/prohibitin superfamily)